MPDDTYVVVGFVTAIAALVIGVAWSARDYKEYGNGMLIADLVMAFMMAVVAGAAWPISMLIGTIVGGIKWLEHQKKPAPPPQPKPPTDSERYSIMAAEQRALAGRARKDGMEDLAKMQEDLAVQYEQAANIYRTAK